MFMKTTYGGIAQLARAHGSYPWCRRFKSVFRYFLKQILKYLLFYIIIKFELSSIKKVKTRFDLVLKIVIMSTVLILIYLRRSRLYATIVY